MNRHLIGLAALAAITAPWAWADWRIKSRRHSHARRAAERGRK